MRKPAFAALALAGLLLLSSCSILDRAEQMADDLLEKVADAAPSYENPKKAPSDEIVRCFGERDAEGLKALLCPKTREMEDIDAQIDAAFALFEGEVTQVDDDLSGSEGESKRKGVVTLHDQRWFIDLETDAGRAYEIDVHRYLVFKSNPDKEGFTRIELSRDDGEWITIGYEWTDYSAPGRFRAHKVLEALSDGNRSQLKSYLCETTLALPDTDRQIEEAFSFFDGAALFGENADGPFEYDGRYDIDTEVASEETAKDNAPARTFITLSCENILTDKNGDYNMEFYEYIDCIDNESYVGISQIILTDKRGRRCVIGEKIPWEA